MSEQPNQPQQAERELWAGERRQARERLNAIFPVNAAFPLALAMLAALAFFAHRNTAALMEIDEKESHSHVVIHELDRLLWALADAETGRREFLITGDGKYLERYRQATGQVDGQMATLKSLAQDNPLQQRRLQAIDAPIAETLARLEQTLVARHAQGLQDAQAVAIANLGMGIQDGIRARVDELQQEEQRALQVRGAGKVAKMRGAINTGVFGFSLCFAVLILVFYRLRKEIVERINAEAAVSTQRNRLKMMVDALPHFIWTALPDGRRDYTSQQWMHYSGVGEDEVLGDGWLGQVHPDDRRPASTAWQDAVRQGSVLDVEFRIRRADGVCRWFKTRAIPQRDSAGSIVKWFGSNTDIDDLRQAKQELKSHRDELETLVCQRTVELEKEIAEHAQAEAMARKSEAKYRELVHEANSAIIRWRQDGTITFFNEYALSFFGYREQDVIGKDVRMLIPETESDGSDLTSLYDDIISHPEKYASHTNENVLSDGRLVWTAWTNKPILDGCGQLVEMLSVGSDITERKRFHESLQRERTFLRQVLDAVPSVIFVKDREGRFLLGNKALAIGYGISPDAIPGMGDADFNPNADEVAGFLRDDREVLRTGISKHVPEEPVTQADGSVCWFSTVKIPLFGEYGTATKLLGVATDITERKHAVEALQEAGRRKDEFLAMLAHELRNPLTPIMVAAQLLQRRGADDPALVEWAGNTVKNQCDNLIQLVNQLLDVSRVTKGKITLDRSPMDLRDLLGRAVESCRLSIEQHRHELLVALPPAPVPVDADAVRLEQVVGNLLNNAAKYTPDQGCIWVTLACEAETAVIRVRDNGIGITAAMLPKVFDLFTQAERTLDRAQGGLGIGLALVKSLVEMHGGSVKASSEGIGSGSEFEVRLPLLAKAPAAKPVDAPGQAPAAVRRRILVVDDNDDVRVSMALLLRAIGHDVHEADCGQKGLEIACAAPLDAVLLDIGMPGMNGYEVARLLRQQPALAKLTLIAITGYSQDYDRQESQRAGLDYHLVKPLDLSELARILDGLDSAGRGMKKQNPTMTMP